MLTRNETKQSGNICNKVGFARIKLVLAPHSTSLKHAYIILTSLSPPQTRLKKMKPGLDAHWIDTDEEMCKKVRALVYSDRRSVSTILHDRLSMRMLTARWVPKSLSDEQMATRTSVSSALFKRFRSKDDFRLRLVTVDETWVHYYEPENKAQSRQWVGPGQRGQRSSSRNHLLAR